ncbi:hypothetical protein EIN_408870 [Entamoeba invadens IP1]|uniref:Serine aminopeptidase S33 domain-containing protein n=1 Tax=Entamoeba invadens IP1 TaxID=370355 RepID=A0A0A1U274_ENTIV|nr:hypothetical protein EIN_408870 [Entamoeba invadens IP1]ELP85608.1 hypothetical protein EIN_408870 [Entamoeba invadens IP1]|eukprot:XP_004184954.1 hypothetical protein EIN_408870 [Entamoeba invadens IP1]
MECVETTHKINGMDIYSQAYFVENSVCNLLVLHDFGSSGAVYDSVGKYFSQQGMNVYFLDLPGCGKSGGVRGVVCKTEILDVVHAYIKIIKKTDMLTEEQLPLFVVGHGLSGLVSCDLCRYDHFINIVDGVVSINPIFKFNIHYEIIVFVLLTVLFFFIRTYSFTKLKVTFEETEKCSTCDKVISNTLDLKNYYNIVKWGREELNWNWSDKLPLLLIQSESDSISSPEATVQKSKCLLNISSSFMSVKGGTHYFVFTKNEEIIARRIVEWVKTILKKKQ